MRFWIIQMGEMIAGIDGDVRDYRYTLLAKHLASRGHEVVRWSSTFDHFARKFRAEQSATVQLLPRLHVRMLHGQPPYYRNISLARWRQQCHVAQLFREEADYWARPDLLYAGVPVPEWAEEAVSYGKRNRVPAVVDVQDPWPENYLAALPQAVRPIGRPFLARQFNRLGRALREAAGLTAVSQAYLDWALQLARRPAGELDRVFPLGYTSPDTPPRESDKAALRERLRIPIGGVVASFAGSFGNSYDVEAMIDALRLLHGRGRNDVYLVMAGHGDKLEWARARARGLPNMVLPGRIGHSLIQVLYALSTAGLCAYSRNALQSIPYKPLEYMAAGLPIVSSLKGELRGILETERCGLFYRAGDPSSLADQLAWLADNPAEGQRMGKHSKELFHRRYSTKVIYPALAEYLEDLAQACVPVTQRHEGASRTSA